jgi:AraC-like DNA-binding protein
VSFRQCTPQNIDASGAFDARWRGRLMAVTWDATELPPGDRVEALRDTLWRSVVRIEVDHHVAVEGITTHLSLSRLGSLGLLSVKSTGATVRRTPKLVKDDMPRALFLGLQVSGTSMVVQDGKQATLHPGEFALYDTSVPYTLVFDEGVDQHYIRIPREDLALPDAAIRAVRGIALGRDHSVAALASAYFSRLSEDTDLGDGLSAESLAHPTIELVRAVVATELCDPCLSRGPMEDTLCLRIVEFLRAHLAEYDLSAVRIAEAHHISVRHLYGVLSKAGISLGDWIRAHRLEECRKDLARPGSRNITIASIAGRWGFIDAAHFSRVFREAYGLTPKEWRDSRP